MWSRVEGWVQAAMPVILDLSHIAKKVAVDLGLGEKSGDNEQKVSTARLIAVGWALTAAASALTMILVLGETDHLIVAELVAGTLAALGLRTRAGGDG